VSGLLATNVSGVGDFPSRDWPSPSALARSATWPEPLLSEAHTPDTDGMSLLDYAGSLLGWHPDWPEACPSVWHELPALADLDPAPSRPEYGELHLSIFIPPMPVEHDLVGKALHVNYCGGCLQRFEATGAVTTANALRHHIEAEPCAHYAVSAPNQSAAGAEAKGSARARNTVTLR
jgi:hypothetical protein